MWELRRTWRLRVAAAIVLASLLKASDGNTLWAATIPSLLIAGAAVLAMVMLLSRDRAT